jgi:hypothetical protein
LDLSISTFLFKQKLENYYKVKIETEISNIKNCGSGKLKFYSKIFTEFKQPGYLDYDIPKTLRVCCMYIQIDFRSFGKTGLKVFIISSSRISVGAKTFP